MRGTLARQALAAVAALAALWLTAASASTIVKQEPPAGGLRYGQRLLVDDGSCPAGQLKELVGGRSVHGVKRLRRCVHR
jgi:Family of unknown function (DUF6719)